MIGWLTKQLTTQYEQDLETARKEAQLEIANSQNIHKEINNKSNIDFFLI